MKLPLFRQPRRKVAETDHHFTHLELNGYAKSDQNALEIALYRQQSKQREKRVKTELAVALNIQYNGYIGEIPTKYIYIYIISLIKSIP